MSDQKELSPVAKVLRAMYQSPTYGSYEADAAQLLSSLNASQQGWPDSGDGQDTPQPQSLEHVIIRAMTDSVVNRLADGSWLNFNYKNKVDIGAPWLREMFAAVDMEEVKRRVNEGLVQKVADYILANMATEIKTDLKKILADVELREEVRVVIRQQIRVAAHALREEEPDG